MTPDRHAKETAQLILNSRIDAGLKVDGDFWVKSVEASKKFVTWSFKGEPSPTRWLAAVIQKEAGLRGINAGAVDAYFGPQTDDAGDRIDLILRGTPLVERPDEHLAGICESGTSKIRCWNPTTSQFRARYGHEGDNQGMVASPYALRLDWDLDTVVHRFSAHESLVPLIESAMKEVMAHYGLPGIEKLGFDRFGGCLNVRLKRGGSTPSVHSWGAAVDWFPSRNQLKQDHKTALFARDEYRCWFDIWAKFGFMSLGECFDFDWMHVQANPS